MSAEKAYTFRKQCEKVDNVWHANVETPVKVEITTEDSDAPDENVTERIDIVIIKEEEGIGTSKENTECTEETDG